MLKDNIRTSVLVGVLMSTFYSAWVVALYIIGGASAFSAHDTHLGLVVLTYYCTGILGGVLVGIALPLASNPVGAMVVGAAVGLVFFFCIELATAGPISRWTATNAENVVILGVLWGAPGGFLLRRIWMR